MSFLLAFDLVNTRSGLLEEWEYVVLCKDDYTAPPRTDARVQRGQFGGLIPSWRAPGSYFFLSLTDMTWWKPTTWSDVTFQGQPRPSVVGMISKCIHFSFSFSFFTSLMVVMRSVCSGYFSLFFTCRRTWMKSVCVVCSRQAPAAHLCVFTLKQDKKRQTRSFEQLF